MKASLPISVAALFLAATSLFVTLSRPTPTLSDAELDRRVDAALLRKERMYSIAMAPKLDAIYKDMLGPRYTTPEQTPETFAELFKPAIHVVTSLTGGQ